MRQVKRAQCYNRAICDGSRKKPEEPGSGRSRCPHPLRGRSASSRSSGNIIRNRTTETGAVTSTRACEAREVVPRHSEAIARGGYGNCWKDRRRWNRGGSTISRSVIGGRFRNRRWRAAIGTEPTWQQGGAGAGTAICVRSTHQRLFPCLRVRSAVLAVAFRN